MRKKEVDIESRNKAIVFLSVVEKKSLREIQLIFNLSRPAILKIIKQYSRKGSA